MTATKRRVLRLRLLRLLTRLLRRPKPDAKAEEYGTASYGKAEMSQWASVRRSWI